MSDIIIFRHMPLMMLFIHLLNLQMTLLVVKPLHLIFYSYIKVFYFFVVHHNKNSLSSQPVKTSPAFVFTHHAKS